MAYSNPKINFDSTDSTGAGAALFAKVHHLKWSTPYDSWAAYDVDGTFLLHMPLHAVEALAKSRGRVVCRDGWDALWLCLP